MLPTTKVPAERSTRCTSLKQNILSSPIRQCKQAPSIDHVEGSILKASHVAYVASDEPAAQPSLGKALNRPGDRSFRYVNAGNVVTDVG